MTPAALRLEQLSATTDQLSLGDEPPTKVTVRPSVMTL